MNGEADRGCIVRIAGPAVEAEGLESVELGDIATVGKEKLLAEVIRVERTRAVLQVFEDTTGLQVGEPVASTGSPLSVDLGPGLLGQIYDGIQRPLESLQTVQGAFLTRGVSAPALKPDRRWEFVPRVQAGDHVVPGTILGEVEEYPGRVHRVLVPPGVEGQVDEVHGGCRTVSEPVIFLKGGRGLTMVQRWPVKRGRPFLEKLDPTEPFLTGQRVLDAMMPICRGGTAIIPGGFGTGKTVLEQTLAKCSNAEIIVYVGCGERGNEMTDVLTEFPKLDDPTTGRPLMERTILIANTSNMPVAAREASVYVGLTMAEYYRDMGYHVALLADSTSRWAEALREISSRLEEMPGEEGYPTYLASRLAGFYERSGRVRCLGDSERIGSVTIVGAVSPPGGDYSEPVTQSSQRTTGAFWRSMPRWHTGGIFQPSTGFAVIRSTRVNWSRGMSTVCHTAGRTRIRTVRELLQRDAELQEVVQLVGPEGLQNHERVILETGRAIREDFLQQNANSPTDMSCPLSKQQSMLEAILFFHRVSSEAAHRGIAVEKLVSLPQRELLSRMKEVPDADIVSYVDRFQKEYEEAVKQLVP